MRNMVRLIAAVAALLAAAAPPAAATSPGGEGRIAFTNPSPDFPPQSMLSTARVDGSDRRDIARGASVSRWSADGRVLAWSTPEGVYVANADGSGARLVARRALARFALSPDGRKLVVARVLRRREGSKRNWIREDLLILDVATGRERLLAYDGHSPTWSPDGRTIAFVDLRYTNKRRYGAINLVQSNGKHRRQIYNGGTGSETASLDWSPGGAAIAFTQWVGAKRQTQLRVIGVRSRRVRVLAAGVGSSGVWSPTGERLITSVWDGRSAYDLVTVPAGGGAPVPLGFQGVPSSWQPLP